MPQEFPINRAAFSGLLAMLTGLGIARFGYAPLVPALIAAHWFTAAAAFWLGTLNFLGYLAGAAGLRAWRRPIRTRPAVLGLMLLTSLSLLASAANLGVWYAGVWRLLSGIAGGVLMVLMAAAVVGRAPPHQRGRVGGITFAGMGIGIAAAGLLIPRLLPYGLPVTWLTLGGCCLLATLAVAVMMPDAVITPAARTAPAPLSRPVLLLITGYAFCAIGFVPHVLFWSSFVAIGLHRGVAAGAHIAAMLGLAAAIGPPVLGRIADRAGFLRTLAIGYLVMAVSVALPLFTGNLFILALSSIGVGAVALGAVMLTSGALAQMVPPERLAANWALATMAYAVMQAAAAAGDSALFHATASYPLLYTIGAAAAAVSGLLVWVSKKLYESRVWA